MFSTYLRFLAIGLLLVSGGAFGQSTTLSLDEISGEPGVTVDLPVSISGPFAAIQFDLEIDDPRLALNGFVPSALPDGLRLEWEQIAPGQVRVVVYNNDCPELVAQASPGRGNGLVLGDFQITISDPAEPGLIPLALSNALAADDDAQSVSLSSPAGQLEIIRGDAPMQEPLMVPALSPWTLAIAAVMLALIGVVILRARGAQLLVLVIAGSVVWIAIESPPLLAGDPNATPSDIVDVILGRQSSSGNEDCTSDIAIDVRDVICARNTICASAQNRPPQIAPIADQTAIVDEPFELTVQASDPNQDLLDYSLPTAPAGMNVDNQGVIDWTPNDLQLGTHDITVRVTDPEGAFDEASFQVTVIEATGNSAPRLIPPGNRVVEADSSFIAKLFATDPDPGDELTFDLPTAPAGMSVDAQSGDLNWTPETEGTYTVTARVTDTAGLTDTQTFEIEVIAPLPEPVVNSAPRLTVPDNQSLRFTDTLNVTALANDPDPGDVLTFSLVNAPAGMTIDPSSGAINWAPGSADVGVSHIAVQVQDQLGASDFGSFIVQVLDINRAPVALDDSYDAQRGNSLSVPSSGVLENDTDPNQDALSATLIEDPEFGEVMLNPDGSFEYTPDNPVGTIDFELDWEAIVSGGGGNWMPIIANMDDDPQSEILVNLGAGCCQRELRAYDGLDGSVDWDIVFSNRELSFDSQPAVADIDLDGKPELIVIGGEPDQFPSRESILYAFEHDGTLKWLSEEFPRQIYRNDSPLFNFDFFGSALSVADLDQDGFPEIIAAPTGGPVQFTVWDHEGQLIQTVASDQAVLNDLSVRVTTVDLDLDGDLEVVVGGTAWHHDGTLFWNLVSNFGNNFLNTFPIVANLDEDPYPELVRIRGFGGGADRRGNLVAINHDGTIKWEITTSTIGTGDAPLTAADLNQDGFADVIRMGPNFEGYVEARDGRDGSLLWTSPVESGRGGTTVFDFNRDGLPEVLAFDPSSDLHVLNGQDGTLLELFPTVDSGTIRPPLNTSPVFADIDADGQAELVLSMGASFGNTPTVSVYQSPSQDWGPMRSIWNEWKYRVTNINDDLTIPTQEAPHWLQPGLNQARVNQRLPEERREDFDQFTYRASDGEFSDDATVYLRVLTNSNPPQFLSQPDTSGTVNFDYRYAPIVTDPDPGESFTFELTAFPAGMTIDPITGLIRWRPTATGDYNIGVAVTDAAGLSAVQTWMLTVGEPVEVPEVIGLIQTVAESTLTDADLTVGLVREAFSTAFPAGQISEQSPIAGSVAEFGAAVNLTISLGAGPADTDNDGDGFTENEGDCNDADNSIFPGAADPEGDGIDQNCDGFDGVLALESIELTPAESIVLSNRIIDYEAVGITTEGTAVNLNGLGDFTSSDTNVAQLLGNRRVRSAAPGTATVRLTYLGVTGEAVITVVAGVPGDQTPPVAEITSPASGSVVTDLTSVEGIVNDDNLINYELAVAIAQSDEFVLISSGTDEVNNDVLGLLDPTLALNDLYTLRLTAYDAGGNITTDEITVQIDEKLKVGNFSLAYTDLEIPASGIPISINRTYDSRDKTQGDFGVGWRLSLQSIQVRTNRELGSGWQVIQSGLSFGLEATDGHVAIVRLPDGTLEVFDLQITPTVSPLIPFPPFVHRAAFVPRAGTLGQLESLENNNLTLIGQQPGEVLLLDDISNEVYNPSRFKYIGADGNEFILSIDDGVESVTEPNGNTLTFNDTGIFHSAGLQVLFQRDTLGRITKLTDPAGNEYLYRYDGNGDLREFEDADGDILSYKYDQNHGLIETMDPLGRLLARTEYDDQGRIISMTNSDGREITIQRSLDFNQEIVTDADGAVTLMEYDDRGNVTSITDALGNTTTHTYDLAGNQLTTTLPDGSTTTRTFDLRNNLLTETDPLGNQTAYTYGPQDRITSITNPLGQVRSFKYDARGNLVQETDPAGNSMSHSYDANGNRTLTRSFDGAVTSFAYNETGQLTAVTDARGNTQTYILNDAGKRIGTTDKRGNTSTMQLTSDGLPIQMTDPLGNTQIITRDSAGNPIGTTDALGNSTTTEFDAAGKELFFEDAEGQRFDRIYDIKGDLTGVAAENGSSSGFVYDPLGRIIGMRDATGNQSGAEFDDVGRVIKQIDLLGNETQFTYDSAGRQNKITDALGNSTDFVYDAAGNVTRRTDARGNIFEYEYDALGRLSQIRYPDGSTATTGYDAAGRVSSETDQLGRTTAFTYDASGNVQTITDALGNISRYKYDENNNRTAYTDANGNTTRYEYDANNRLIRTSLPDGSFSTREYDAVGNTIRTTDANGDSIEFEYDNNGQQTTKRYPDGEITTFSYTASGNLSASIDSQGTTTYSYDSNNRLTRVDNPDTSSVAYTYDAVGNILSTTATLPDGGSTVVTQTYDALNRVSSVTDNDGNTSIYTYDENGNLSTIANPNGVITEYSYDTLNRMISIVHRGSLGIIERFDYTLDTAGNRLRVEQLDGSTTDFVYDALYRLISEIQRDPGGTITLELDYMYDAVGNRTIKSNAVTGELINYSYGPNDRLLQAGDTSYSYDANGNLIEKISAGAITSFDYDFENLLTEVNGSSNANYRYDAQGIRVQATVDGIETNYLLDSINNTGFVQSIVDYSAAGTQIAAYVFGLDLLSRQQGVSRSYYHYDGSSSTRLLTNSMGVVTDQYRFEAFGSLIAQTGTTDNPHLFSGERLDGNSGFYYLRARYYAPESGRFITRDPFQGFANDPRSLHKYTYAHNDPVNNVDYSGLYTVPNVIAAAAIGTAVITTLTIAYGDTRDLAKLTPARIAYKVVSSAVIGAVSAYFSGAASAAALGPNAGRIVLEQTARQAFQQLTRYAAEFGMRSLAVAGASSAICVGEFAAFEQISGSNALSCGFKGIVTGVLFVVVGGVDAVRVNELAIYFRAADSFIDDLIIANVINGISGQVEAYIDEYLPSPEAIERFLQRIGITGDEAEPMFDAIQSYSA